MRNVSDAERSVIRGSTESEIAAAARPSRTSVNAYVASNALTAMSAAATMPMPPARTLPCTRATTGLGSVAIRRCSSTIWDAVCSMPSALASARSAPEQNVRPSARISTTLTSASASARASPSYTSWTSRRESALRLCWESRTTEATWSSTR